MNIHDLLDRAAGAGAVNVLALDLDVTKAGVALPTGRTRTLLAPARKRGEHPDVFVGRRLAWWMGELEGIVRFYRPDVVAIEAAIHVGGRRANDAKPAVQAMARLAAYRHDATLVDCVYPSQLKKWATGRGDADKADMVAAAVARGATPANDDEADAALLRFMVMEVADSPEALRRWLAR